MFQGKIWYLYCLEPSQSKFDPIGMPFCTRNLCYFWHSCSALDMVTVALVWT